MFDKTVCAVCSVSVCSARVLLFVWTETIHRAYDSYVLYVRLHRCRYFCALMAKRFRAAGPAGLCRQHNKQRRQRNYTEKQLVVHGALSVTPASAVLQPFRTLLPWSRSFRQRIDGRSFFAGSSNIYSRTHTQRQRQRHSVWATIFNINPNETAGPVKSQCQDRLLMCRGLFNAVSIIFFVFGWF